MSPGKKTKDGEVANGWIQGIWFEDREKCWIVESLLDEKKMVDGEETNDGKNNGWRAKW